ncbi:MAG: GNAT family N-acetyltransferase [Candidatus Pacebacteria bacterium]|nr:GNAT family N-acetyltransferase [Candidatus Paceibacterota bacterium]
MIRLIFEEIKQIAYKEYLFDDVDIYIIDHDQFCSGSGYWQLDESISRQISDVVISAFGDTPVDEVNGIGNFLTSTKMIAVAVHADRVVGFAACKPFPFSDYRLFFLTSMAVDEDYMRKRIGFRLIHSLLESSEMEYLVLVTQSPVMYCLLEKVSIICCPGANTSDYLPLVRRLLIMAGGSGFFDEKTFIYYDFYSRCPYSHIPLSDNKEVNRFFENSLNISARKQSKDVFLLLARRNMTF